MATLEQPSPRGLSLVKVLTETPYRFIQEEVEDMTVEEAKDVWACIKPFFVGVCARSGSSRIDVKWDMLVKKMSLIREKAGEA